MHRAHIRRQRVEQMVALVAKPENIGDLVLAVRTLALTATPAATGDQKQDEGESREQESHGAILLPKETGLMRGLLRQPGGFEGLGSIAVEPYPDDLSVPQREDIREFQCRRHSTARPPTLLAADADHPIPMVDQIADVDLPRLEWKCREPVFLENALISSWPR
jgi:hypothetical protein